MPTLPSREELKSMMYRDLQKICKDWGVRANLKSDEMIDLLLEAQSRNTPALPPQPPMQQRSVSTRRSSRAGPSRTSSVIIHDIPEEMPQQQTSVVNPSNTNADAPAIPPVAAPPTRKKAKELQRRLGVGRPVAAGGTGPRAVTRSSTISRERRLRSSRSTRPMEATIQEEPEPLEEPQRTNPLPQPQPVTPMPAENAGQPTEKEKQVGVMSTVPDYQKLLSDIVKPLQDQIETLRAEVKRLQQMEIEFYHVRDIVDKMKARRLSVHLDQLQEETESRRQPLSLPPNPSTPPAIDNLQVPSDSRTLMPSPRIPTRPGASPILLGKRPREPSTTESPVAEHDNAQGTPQSPSGPVRKRPKLSEEASDNKGKASVRDELAGSMESSAVRDRVTSITMPRITSFIVYNDPDEEGQYPDSPPPNNLLPDYYTSRSGGPTSSPKQGRPTSSANAPENQNPFDFSFLPAPSTPGPSPFMPSFPYPEPPQSPTPAGTSLAGSLGTANERTDVFKTFGLPPPDRARRLPGSSSDNTINPADLSQRNPSGKQRLPSSNEIGAGLGFIRSTSGESSMNSEREAPAVKKTMYGTELEADTRFGDFGVEGVATGFWAGGRF